MVMGCFIVPYVPNADNAPKQSGGVLSVEKAAYEYDETVKIGYFGADEKDWVGVFQESETPQSDTALYKESVSGDGEIRFSAEILEPDKYYGVYLCTDDSVHYVDFSEIYIADDDFADYGALSVTLNVAEENGVSKVSAAITPSAEKELEYMLFWSNNGIVLADYEPIEVLRHSGSEPFEVKFNDGIFMPENANSLTVKVRQGHSSPVSTSAPRELKVGNSPLLHSYAVLTDIHINQQNPNHLSHFPMALKEINTLYPNIDAIFTCGDNTDSGEDVQYELLMNILEANKPNAPVFFAMGNHDFVGDGKTALNRINTFVKYTGMPNSYYSVDVNGTKCIFLASDYKSLGGRMSVLQILWLRNELRTADKNDRIMIFMHQPLIETVSGSLNSLDKEKQDWYGFSTNNCELRMLLKEYPNAVLFTGHTHWTVDSVQPVLMGMGKDANFVNCASVGYLWNDDDTGEKGSECMFVEEYEDFILLRAREIQSGKWCASTQIRVPTVK